MMPVLLAISPHLDDAVFSCGGTLAQSARDGWRVIIATCFTANVASPRGFALACQTDKGIDPQVDYMALRRQEDVVACAALGASPVHLPFLEAPNRGYQSATALFDGRHPNDTIQSMLQPALCDLIDELQPELILGPMGLGSHVDHLVIAASLAALSLGPRFQRWEDWPYIDRLPDDQLAGRAHVSVPLTKSDIDAKITACCAYQSQLGFQFGSVDAMVTRLRNRSCERLLL